ncbi:MAG: hypothetical protein Q9187_006141 [Circinaria calcarea]
MSPYWLNNSCSAFTSLELACTLGNIASYAVNFNCVDDAAAGLKFVKENNIRFTVKNTGHDFLGRSTGVGHGPLEGIYGLGANNTLEFEVVTADGRHLVATPTKNSHLYWALNSGGGGTYAVVLSQTTKAYADGPVAGGSIRFNNMNDVGYWSAVEAWQKRLLVFDNIAGFNSVWGFTNETFVLSSAKLPGANASTMSAALNPFIQELEKLNVVHTYETSGKSTYYEHFAQYTPNLPFGDYSTNEIIGGRLIPRSAVQNTLTDLLATFRNISRARTHRFKINGIASNVTHTRVGNTLGSNAVLPAWRDSLYWLNMDVRFDPAGTVETIQELQAQMNENQDQLKVLNPGSGGYMNEGRFDNPDWKRITTEQTMAGCWTSRGSMI